MIAAGEKLTCPSGHLIGTAERDIKVMSELKRDNFRLVLRQATETRCTICGEAYIQQKSRYDGVGIYPTNDEGEVVGPEISTRTILALRAHIDGRGWVEISCA